MAYTNNTFTWYENASTDKDAAKAFYTEVIGWKTHEMDMGPAGTYVAVVAGDKPRGGLIAAQPGVPSHWVSYLRVEDVDASAAAAKENGGAVLAEPFSVPGVGRIGVVADPQGAAFALFHEENEAEAANPPAGAGAFHWTELWAKDITAVLPFYEKTFGLTTEKMAMPDGDYYLLKSGETMIGGAMQSKIEAAPAMWLPWVEVADVDATVARATSHGGDVKAPAFDVPGVGYMSIIGDSNGAVIGVITPAQNG
jgi:uncharacterized protein